MNKMVDWNKIERQLAHAPKINWDAVRGEPGKPRAEARPGFREVSRVTDSAWSARQLQLRKEIYPGVDKQLSGTLIDAMAAPSAAIFAADYNAFTYRFPNGRPDKRVVILSNALFRTHDGRTFLSEPGLNVYVGEDGEVFTYKPTLESSGTLRIQSDAPKPIDIDSMKRAKVPPRIDDQPNPRTLRRLRDARQMQERIARTKTEEKSYFDRFLDALLNRY